MEKFGRYILERSLGTGGMAEVYLARAPGPQGVAKALVIKRIRPELSEDPEFVGLFTDEARISMLLQHGNIVPVFDFGTIDGRHFLAMEYVDGLTLEQIGSCCGPLPVDLAVYIASELCAGLQHAHELSDPQGRKLAVVHRDVSPQNIMIPNDGEVKLLDFGIARARNRVSRTAVGLVRGKPLYLSPEQVTGMPVDARSDLFSLGTVLYGMLTGRNPFEASSPEQTLERIARARVEAPSRSRQEIGPIRIWLLLKVLARKPANRHQSAAELGEDLFLVLHQLPPSFLPRTLSAFVRGLGHGTSGQGGRQAAFEAALLQDLPQPRGTGATSPAEPAAIAEELLAPPIPPARKHRWPWWAAAAVVLASLVGLSVWLVPEEFSSRPDGPEPGPPKDQAPEAAPPPEEAPPAIAATAPDPSQGQPVELGDAGQADEPPGRAVESPARERQPVTPKDKPRTDKQPSPASGSARRTDHLEPVPTGTVQINSVPWANVYLDGERLGHTPLMDLKLPAGRHTFTLRNPEFGQSKDVTIEVAADQTAKTVVHLLE